MYNLTLLAADASNVMFCRWDSGAGALGRASFMAPTGG
jgi:hypothetical protein